jgi:hypothetical protein
VFDAVQGKILIGRCDEYRLDLLTATEGFSAANPTGAMQGCWLNWQFNANLLIQQLQGLYRLHFRGYPHEKGLADGLRTQPFGVATGIECIVPFNGPRLNGAMARA